MSDSIDKFLDNSVYDDDEYDDEPIHPPMVVNRDQVIQQHHDNVIDNAKDDYEFVRTNLKQIVETNVKALEGLAKVAQESDSPRAYEVLSSFMKQMTDANESLMRLHKDAKEITSPIEGGSSGEGGHLGGVTNNYYAGSTEDLLDLVESMESKGTPISIDDATIVDDQ